MPKKSSKLSLEKRLARAGLPCLPPPTPLVPDAPHQEYRLASGEQVFGATTYTSLLPKDLLPWVMSVTMRGKNYKKISDSAKLVGTFLHHHAHRSVTGATGREELPVTKEESEQIAIAMRSWNGWWSEEKHFCTPIACEVQLVSESHKFGGTMDLVGIHEGVVTLYDYKTSSKLHKDYWVQQSAYVRLWNERYPDFPIDRAMLVKIGKKPNEEGHETETRLANELDAQWDIFTKLLALGRALEAMK